MNSITMSIPGLSSTSSGRSVSSIEGIAHARLLFSERTRIFAHLKADAFVFFDLRPIRFQQFIHAAADVAAAQKTHDDLFHAFVRPSFK